MSQSAENDVPLTGDENDVLRRWRAGEASEAEMREVIESYLDRVFPPEVGQADATQ